MTAPRDRLEILRDEILRWNTQINLVARVDTRRLVDDLVRQCQLGWDLVNEALQGDPGRQSGLVWSRARLVDIGSGAGLPGLVWAAARTRGDDGHSTCLVEPREKRAWFLRRTAREMRLDSVSVTARRWDEIEPAFVSGGAPALIVSMKALHLADPDVLGPLAAQKDGVKPVSVCVARFLKPEHESLPALKERFLTGSTEFHAPWRLVTATVLGHARPRLMISVYSCR